MTHKYSVINYNVNKLINQVNFKQLFMNVKEWRKLYDHRSKDIQPAQL